MPSPQHLPTDRSRPPAHPRTALAVLVALTAILAVACQPVDSGVPPAGEPATGEGATEGDFAPQPDTLPADLTALLGQLEPIAAEWQVETVVSEIAIRLHDGGWSDATVTFLAPDADRLLLAQVDSTGTRQQRPTFDTLDLEPVPAAGLAEVPPLPSDTLDPLALLDAAGGALERCPIGTVTTVLYSTGAPTAWDGTAWTESPVWTAILDGDGGAVMVDPATGQALLEGCIERE